MAKALYGHVSAGADRRLIDEITRLRHRVKDLEAELAKLRAATESDENDLDDRLRKLSSELHEPALT